MGVQFIYEDQDISIPSLQGRPADNLTPEIIAELPEDIKEELLKAAT